MDIKADGVTLLKEGRVDQQRVRDAITELLLAIGEDPERPGIKDTPARVARYWTEFMDYHPGTITTMFEEQVASSPVTVSHMRVHSLCEHHLMPFWCDITVSYVPNGKVIGLSKIARIAHMHAHRLQLQERLVAGIADTLCEVAKTNDVMVVGSGEHSCMVARGIRTPGLMTSQEVRGAFLLDSGLRFDVLAQHRKT